MLALDGISKVYPDGTEALSDVTVSFQPGMVGLLGPNGSGKTTLLSLITLKRSPTAGAIRFLDRDAHLSCNRAFVMRRIGYLPQEYSPIAALTGEEYLLFCARIRCVPLGRRAMRERVRALLNAVGLEKAGARRTAGYSGGMKRRLGIAQAIIHQPDLLIVDEPTAGLDPGERIRFRQLITAAASRMSVILSTHIVEDVEATCPRIVVMREGRIAFDGNPGELLTRVVGKLWEVDPSTASLDAPGAPVVGRRVLSDGTVRPVVLSEVCPPGGVAGEPTMESAYRAFQSAGETREAR